MTEIPRDRWGRPLVTPPGGGKPVAYDRASSFGDVLDDKTALAKWQSRMAAKGVAERPDLYLAILATPLEEKGKLNHLVEQAIEHAGGSRAATTGTALHQLTELIDLGQPLPVVPEQYRADLDAYRAATRPFKHRHVETFLVNDELKVAGTPDRISDQLQSLTFKGGLELGPATRITDLKTGSHGGYMSKYSAQLAIYSRSVFYNPTTGERTPLGDVDQDWGVIFWAPASEGRCELIAIDLKAGWEAALLAADVRAWRRRKGVAVAA